MESALRREKKCLRQVISGMAKEPSLLVVRPGKDFTRNRLLPLETVLSTLVSMGGQSLGKELYLQKKGDLEKCPSVSAFVQQRGKVRPEACRELFHRYNKKCRDAKTYGGYRLLAVDGSDVNIARNPDSDTYMGNGDRGGFNQFHVNALYDVLNHTYLDAIVEPKTKYNEQRAAGAMCKASAPKKAILLADRGYGGFNLFESLRRNGTDYLIRVKNDFCREIAALPMKDFDTVIHIEIRTTQTNRDKEDCGKCPNIHYLSGISKYGKDKVSTTWDFESPCKMSLRVVRFRIAENSYETIITSLPREQFPADRIKYLYHLRWGIETSFRDLKYTIGLTNFHARKEEFILQEIYARLTMYNLAERVVNALIVHQDQNRKFTYKVAFSDAAFIIRDYLKSHDPPDAAMVEAHILQHVIPIRPGRADERKMKPKSVVCFLYRVA